MLSWAIRVGVAGMPMLVAVCLIATPGFSRQFKELPGKWTSGLPHDIARVVSVLPVLPPGQRPSQKEPEGSGIVIAGPNGDTRIVTAAHVLKRAVAYRVRTTSGRVLAAKLIGADQATDIALLSVDTTLIGFLLPKPRSIEAGSQVCAIGNAFGLGVSVSCGVVSAVNVSRAGFNPIEDFVQTDASVNPGMSGGALVNERGELIGMLSAIFTKTSDANIGVNFAVSGPLLKRVMADLDRHGRVKRIASGMILTDHLRRGETGQMAARVVRVRDGTAAARAGVSPGDLLVAVRAKRFGMEASRQIKKVADFVSFTATLPLPYMAIVTVLRNGKKQKIELKVGE